MTVLASGAQGRPAQDAAAALRACLRAPRDTAARCLVDRIAPRDLERALFDAPEIAGETLEIVAGGLSSPSADALQAYVAESARARTARLSALGAWSDEQGEALLRLQLVDPERFVEDAAFRARILA